MKTVIQVVTIRLLKFFFFNEEKQFNFKRNHLRIKLIKTLDIQSKTVLSPGNDNIELLQKLIALIYSSVYMGITDNDLCL